MTKPKAPKAAASGPSVVKFDLHPAQLEVFNSKARFIIVKAGRRLGKSYLAAVKLLIEGLKDTNSHGYDLRTKDVFYVAPTQQQARDVMWLLLKTLGQGLIALAHENTMVMTLINGRRVHLKGADRPDTMRGVGLSFAVLDEYALMKPDVWELILRPTLADVLGGALFISTPRPEADNPMNVLWDQATEDTDWETFKFKSSDNPFLRASEIESMRRNMSRSAQRQELDAETDGGGGYLLDPDLITIGPEPPEGHWFMAVDLAGFTEVNAAMRMTAAIRRLDSHAIACVKVHEDGWHVADIVHGRWEIREVSLRILRACQKYRPMALGIEGGALKNAVMPYLTDQMRRLSIYPNVLQVTHGGQRKVERITWALQGRLQNGRITFADGPYLKELTNQMLGFPAVHAHDDLLDALAYIDQVGSSSYGMEDIELNTFTPLDKVSGY